MWTIPPAPASAVCSWVTGIFTLGGLAGNCEFCRDSGTVSRNFELGKTIGAFFAEASSICVSTTGMGRSTTQDTRASMP